MSTITTAIEQEISKYIQKNDIQKLKAADFVSSNQHLIAKSLTPGQNFKEIWMGCLAKVANDRGLKLEKSRPDWSLLDILYEKLVQNEEYTSKNSTSSKSQTNCSNNDSNDSNNSNNSNKTKLSKQDIENIENMFKSLNPQKFWKLSSGTLVEEQMKKFALTCSHEHPCHSMIMDPQDSNWKNYFTDEELFEIEREGEPKFCQLPVKMNQYLDNYKNLTSLDDIWTENTKHSFHPIEQADMNWLDSSVARAVDIIMKNIHKNYETEADLMKRVWVLIDCCFDDGGVDAISGEYVSKATTARVNTDRSIAAIKAMSRRKIGTKTDMLFTTEFLELGTCEAGKVTDINNTKTIYEAGMKIPKTLKDMMYLLANECPSQLRQLKTCGFVISGLSILPLIMDSPKGYICRINRPSRFFHHPTDQFDFLKNMRSIVRIIYNAKIVMNDVNRMINETEEELEFGSHADVILPLSFIPETSPTFSKKRKLTSADSEQVTSVTTTATT